MSCTERYYLKVFAPKLFLQGKARLSSSDMVYGFDLQPTHLDFHQLDSESFLSYLYKNDWKIIYLTHVTQRGGVIQKNLLAKP